MQAITLVLGYNYYYGEEDDMSTALALSLGILFFVVWVCAIVYIDTLRKVYTQGRIDTISKINRKRDFKGMPLRVYNAGRRAQVMERRLKIHKTGHYRGHPTAHG